MRRRLSLTVASVLLVAFLAPAALAQTQYDEIIHGAWQWVETDDNGQISNPGTLGHEIAIEFDEDFSYREYHDNVLVIDSTYSTFLVDDGGDWLYVDRPDPRFTANAFRSSPELLVLRDDHTDPSVVETWIERGPVAVEGPTWSGVKRLFD